MASSYIAGLSIMLSPNSATIGVAKVGPLLSTDVPPIITIQQITGEEVESLGGLSQLTQTVMQFNVWNRIYESAFSRRVTLVSILSAFTGLTYAQGPTVERITEFRYRDLYDEQRELHQLVVRCVIWWRV